METYIYDNNSNNNTNINYNNDINFNNDINYSNNNYNTYNNGNNTTINNHIGNENMISEKYVSNTFENIVLPVVWSVLFIYLSTTIIFFIYYRKRPQLEYRSVKLTLLYGFSSTLYILLILAARIFKFSCVAKLWITDIFVVISIFSLMSMGIRIIYLWKLNCYKLSNSKRKPITYNSTYYEPEANTYFKAVYKFINKISKRLIILPIIFDFIITGITSFSVKDSCYKSPFAFAPIIIFNIIFSFTCPYFIYQLHKVHEYQRITTEVEYILTTISLFILISAYIVVTVVPKYKNNELLQYYTNDGVFFFVLQELIGFIIIMNIPFIELLCDRRNYKNFDDQISIEYFYKLINDPIIVEELKEVAISEFSIENVLFWESYRELMKLSKYKKGNAIKKIFNGISNVHKNMKQNNINKIISNNQYSNNFFYEKNNSGSNKYNKLMNNSESYDSYESMNKNQFYSNNYYDNFYSRNNNTNNLLEEFNGKAYMKESQTYAYGNPISPTNYAYIDENMNDKYNNRNYYHYNQVNGQRRRSIKQYNINLKEERANISEKSYDTVSLASSEVTADTPVPLKLYNYYQNFYHTFINVNSTAAVNINCSVRKNIEDNIKNPKIGIFDEAKEEVILLMFRNLCPKLILQLKRKEMI